MSSGERIKKDLGVTTITITSDDNTDICQISASKISVSFINGVLIVDTPNKETLYVYSISGNLLYTTVKEEGVASYYISNLQDGIYIVTGSSGWSKKNMK